MTLCQLCRHASELWETDHGDRVECSCPRRLKEIEQKHRYNCKQIVHNQRSKCEFYEAE